MKAAGRAFVTMLSLAAVAAAILVGLYDWRVPRAAMDEYLASRRGFEATPAPVPVRTDASEIRDDQFDETWAVDVRRIIDADMARRTASDRGAIMAEVPRAGLRINQPYPTTSPLATFPPLLLAALPPLPDDLEYRFMGRDLIIRDRRTNLIVHLLPNVAPARIGR